LRQDGLLTAVSVQSLHLQNVPTRNGCLSQKAPSHASALLRFYDPWSQASCPWQCLYFLPEPQGQGSLRPTRGVSGCCRCMAPAATLAGSASSAASGAPPPLASICRCRRSARRCCSASI